MLEGTAMVLRQGAEVVWESLVREKVEVVFGIPGGAVIPLYHVLPDYPIRHVLMRHEQAAVHAADAYARATGKLGVCLATSGPGATNLVTGLATAQLAESPLVAITGQAPSRMLGTDAFQEVDITSIMDAVAKHTYLVTAVEELPRAIEEAVHIARTGRPGPVVLTITSDAQRSEIAYVYPTAVDLPGYRADDRDEPARLGPGSDLGAKARVKREPAGVMLREMLHCIWRHGHSNIILVIEQGLRDWIRDDCERGTILSPGAMRTSGFALPAAIGAQIGRYDDQVWVIASGADFQVSVRELATVTQEELPIRLVILTGCVPRASQERAKGRSEMVGGSLLSEANLAKLADAYGIPAFTVREAHELEVAILEASSWQGTVLIDIQCRQIGWAGDISVLTGGP
jgi:thiamine pyrophosphate-dependent acetolactate synthase large subunit-like protein